jgi:hypothetical protein
MHDPPLTVLATEHCGRAQREWCGFAGPDLYVAPFDLDDIGKLSRCVFGDAFEGVRLTLAPIARSSTDLVGLVGT